MNTEENQLVYGDITVPAMSVRARELASDLELANPDIVDHYVQGISNASSMQEVQDLLYDMSDHNLNLVGSRGYVYDAGKLAGFIRPETNSYTCNLNNFTRNCGLRKTVERLCH